MCPPKRTSRHDPRASPRFRATPGGLLLPFFVSLLLHLVLMAGVRIRPPVRASMPVTMEARLRVPVPPVREVAGPAAPSGRSRQPGLVSRHRAGDRATGFARPVADAAVVAETPVSPTRSLSTEAILTAAMEIGHADAVAEAAAAVARRPGARRPEPALLDRPLQPELARVLAGDGGGKRITSFANGIIKVTTTAGTTYCLFPPPSIVQGALPMTGVAMTCP